MPPSDICRGRLIKVFMRMTAIMSSSLTQESNLWLKGCMQSQNMFEKRKKIIMDGMKKSVVWNIRQRFGLHTWKLVPLHITQLPDGDQRDFLKNWSVTMMGVGRSQNGSAYAVGKQPSIPSINLESKWTLKRRWWIHYGNEQRKEIIQYSF